MSYGNLNVDTVTTSTTGGVLGAGNASIMKNRIINGAMVIDQRNAGASVTPAPSGYTLDRWNSVNTQSSKLSVQQNAGSVTPPTGFANYLGVTSLSAYTVGTSEQFSILQYIEGYNIADLAWGTANAKTVTLSFWAYSSLTGTFGGVLRNNSGTQASYPFSYSIPVANTWTQISITVAGSTSGTWLTTNGQGLAVSFSMGTGATLSGTAGTWSSNYYASATGATSVVGTSGATFYITGVQLEVGSSATGFEYVNYQTSLANCQRYYQGIVLGLSYSTPAGSAGGNVAYPVYMRASPTATIVTAPNYVNASAYVVNAATNAQSLSFTWSSAGSGYLTGGLTTVSAEL